MPSTIGQQLKAARIDRNLSFEDVLENTHIRIKYLKALEADDFSIMPSPVQGRGFLRSYAQYLKLDIDKLLEELRSAEKQGSVEAFQKVEDDKILAEEANPIPISEESASETLWERFQHRLTETLASPEPDSVQETESLPIAEASQKTARPEKPVDVEETLQTARSEKQEESHVIFKSIGTALRERREMLSLTYTEIEGHIHLRPHYLIALEAGDFGALPSPVQTRGMLSNYADFLDLDSEKLLIHFAEGLQAQRLERHIETREHLEGTQKKRRRFSFGSFVAPDLIFGVGMVALLIGFTIWGLGRIANSRVEAEIEATAPSIAEILMITPTVVFTETATPTIVVNTPAPEADGATEVPIEDALPEGEDLGVQILVTMMERAWLRVSVDGEVTFEGRSQPNATFVYEGNESIEVLTANGAGVRIAYNQQDMGLMGGFGEVVQRLYGARGILTPTVTPTSLATATSTPTSTPTPTQTPTVVITEAVQ
jgi:cytoskeleton protein RodZ